MSLRLLLLPFSWIYGLILLLRNLLYDLGIFSVYQPPVKVISIGNISTGGTGKTPFAEFLIQYFQHHHQKVAYLSRGYGRNTKGFYWVDQGQGDGITFGDEALQVATKFPEVPVAVCESRAEGIPTILSSYPGHLIILDDAFQHRKVSRDLDIIMIDANRLPVDDFLLPAGNLREPLQGIKRAHVLVINKWETTAQLDMIQQKLKKYKVPQIFIRSGHQEVKMFYPHIFHPPRAMEEIEEAVIFSGLGNNPHFLRQLQIGGLKVKKHFFFPDHYQYLERDIRKIADSYQNLCENSPTFEGSYILTTEKDFQRLKHMPFMQDYDKLPWAYLPLQIEIVKGEAIFNQLMTPFL